ncbi:hypothetical protein EZS27_018463 [termite gut metagenome]|uniref:SGNH/GDSL hydrolase family protein n=1 Tax=termite gut metagenome TaxID=433724 RepID=A0A5J4RJ17_9ZZZZ
MKSFLLTILLFFIIPIIIIMSIWVCNYTNSPIIEIKEKVLILGDSHTQDAVNDTIFTESFNYSQGGDPFIYSYAKLVSIASVSKIDKLILSVSPVSLNNDTKNWIYKINKLLFYFPPKDLIILFRYAPRLLLKPIFNFYKKEFNKVGGYAYNDRFKLQEDIKRLTCLVPENSCVPPQIQLLYLDKIVEYCKSKSIKLIFINTPMYHAERFYNMDNFYKIIEKKYNDVTFWDYGDYILPDSCYGDVGHLNHIGAKKFSAMLQEKVRNKYNQ